MREGRGPYLQGLWLQRLFERILVRASQLAHALALEELHRRGVRSGMRLEEARRGFREI